MQWDKTLATIAVYPRAYKKDTLQVLDRFKLAQQDDAEDARAAHHVPSFAE
ncbi:hypothetical protein SCP_0706550 [Sparassis crispa]|uniref:Uncharacterized protein n=1 Tax=Sparassis crispa TaxID=139825 RepID=A0A401GTB3_9APHY|nr:hypothetical protein SCP_0706550 [Sparassis crispa]GBE85468.1 hypothetical protein SCP_0706550 [Sparassis crispa]